MSAQREMTLREWVDKLPNIHVAHKELDSLQATIAQQTERIAELEKREFDWARSNAKCTDRIAAQAALIERCRQLFNSEHMYGELPSYQEFKREALAAIAAQKGVK